MKIEKAECSYQVTKCDLKFGEQITLDGELLISVSILDKIRAEIEKAIWEDILPLSDETGEITDEIRIPLLNPDDVFEIIDKYKAEREGKE